MEKIIIRLNYLSEYSQQQLSAYRKLGSVQALRRLQQQEMKRTKRLKMLRKALKNIFLNTCLAFDIWIIISWIDISLHNMDPDPVYLVWNFFNLFV